MNLQRDVGLPGALTSRNSSHVILSNVDGSPLLLIAHDPSASVELIPDPSVEPLTWTLVMYPLGEPNPPRIMNTK